MNTIRGDLPPDIIAALKEHQHIVALTGAGISAESGVPTFRDAQTGLWSKYKPEDLATPQAFRKNPQLVWNWYRWRQSIIQKAEPNPGHTALATLENLSRNFTLITQNVDGLHRRAGSRNIIELHGNIFRYRCTQENKVFLHDRIHTSQELPQCPNCNALLRPDVVWFGEPLSADTLDLAFKASTSCDIFLTIGTSALVHPAASLPIIAKENDAIVIEINIQSTPITKLADIHLPISASKALPMILQQVWGEAPSRA